MIKIFGRQLCSACQEKKAELDAQGVKYTYHDLDTAEGLAEAAYHGLLGKGGQLALPIILEIDPQDHTPIDNPIEQVLQDGDGQDGQDGQDSQDSQDKKPEDPVNPVNRRV